MSKVVDIMDEQKLVARNMARYGGGFVRPLGQALFYADPENAEKIKQAFPEYWKKYRTWEEKE